jgi:hypothetical protein
MLTFLVTRCTVCLPYISLLVTICILGKLGYAMLLLDNIYLCSNGVLNYDGMVILNITVCFLSCLLSGIRI